MNFDIFLIILLASSSSQLGLSHVTINHGPWSEILENWVVLQSNNSRAARAITIGNKTVTVSTKISTTNKRDVSETDLYLLGTIYKNFKKKKRHRKHNFKTITLVIK